MDQHTEDGAQVLYQGRWVDHKHFRVFVYGSTGKKLANSYEEYSCLIASGNWFSTPEEIKKEQSQKVTHVRSRRKAKNGTDS